MNEKTPVLYAATLKPEWIDFVLEHSIKYQDSEKKELKEVVKDYLSYEIESETSLRKTISQLHQTVGPSSCISSEERVNIYYQMNILSPGERKILRLRLLVGSNPFVKDVVNAIYKIYVLGVSGIQASQLYERIAGKYGDRGTVPRRVRYVLSTLVNFGVLENKNRKWYVVDEEALEFCIYNS